MVSRWSLHGATYIFSRNRLALPPRIQPTQGCAQLSEGQTRKALERKNRMQQEDQSDLDVKTKVHKPRALHYGALAITLFCLSFSSFSYGVDGPQEKTSTESKEDVELSGIEVKSTKIKIPEGAASEGYRVDKVSVGPLGEVSEKDAPYAISTVSSEMIENTMATNTAEAVKYLPTVQVTTGGSQITPYFAIRGFSASTWTYNIALDGMRSFDIYEPLEDKERIEQLSGTNSIFYGITNPAGIVNYVLKRPTGISLARLSVDNYDQQFYTHLELGGQVKKAFGKELEYRLNLLYGDAGEAGVEHQTQERYLASGAMDWHTGKYTTVSLDASWSKRDLDYAQPLFMPSTASGVPAAPDTNKNWGAPYTGAWDTTTRVGLKVATRLTDVFSLRSNYRFTDIKRRYFLNRIVFQNKALSYRWRVDSQTLADTYVPQFNLYADAKFTTGPVRHVVTFGGSVDYFDTDNNGYRGTTYPTIYPATLYGTPSYRPYTLPPAGTSTAQTTTYENALIVDRIEIGKHWAALAGGSLSRVNDRLTSVTAANVSSVTKYDDYAFTPNVALSFKPINAVTTYYSFGQGLQEGSVVPSGSTNAGTIFSPFVSNQNEIGVKTQFSRVNANVALFRIQQANQYTTTSNSLTTYHQDGRTINKGAELTVSGKLTDSLTFNGGYTLTDAKIDKTSSTALQGKVAQGAAEQTGRLYLEYALPAIRNLILTGGVSFTGNTWVDASNTMSVPVAHPADAGLRYQTRLFGRDTVMRLDLNNFTGENYWTTRSGILYPGSPRIVTGSITVARF
jgi:iron complex outermembrane recepter protein